MNPYQSNNHAAVRRQSTDRDKPPPRPYAFESLEQRMLFATDTLYVGNVFSDQDASSNDTVEKFNAATGAPLGTFVQAGYLSGVRQLLFYDDSLLAISQNPYPQTVPGDIYRFDASGKYQSTLISKNDANPPFAPRGMVIKDNVLYVSDEGDPDGSHSLGIPRTPRIAEYNATTGAFLNQIITPVLGGRIFQPDGLVFDNNGSLYAAGRNGVAFDTTDDAGWVLRFNVTTGAYETIIGNDGDGIHQAGEIADLHAPDGIVLGPDGKLYVSCPRSDEILVVDPAIKTVTDRIGLPTDQNRAYAQGLLFGPGGKLYVPMSSDGSLRRYDVATKSFELLDPPATLRLPWYLTFGRTNPQTLEYDALPPTFKAGGDQMATDQDGPQSVAGWAKITNDDLVGGLGFVISSDNPSLFAASPSIDPNTGNLSFTPAPNAHGTAHLTVKLGYRDNQASTSYTATQEFTITVTKRHPWHNSLNALDVTDANSVGTDGFIVAGDVLAIINYINAHGSGPVPANAADGPPYLDTANSADGSLTGDDEIVAYDVLVIINFINSGAPGPGPAGEDSSAALAAATDPFFFDLGLSAWTPRRRIAR
jgi:sugar lactone lactonase YvrE